MNVTIRQATVGHFGSEPDRAVACRPIHDGPETRTRWLPCKYQAAFEVDGDLFGVLMVVDAFFSGEDVRVGVRRFEVEADTGPLSGSRVGRVPVQHLLLDAVRRWSMNSDRSEVTDAQARALVRSAQAAPPSSSEERWRKVATVYEQARADRQPTTVAVATAFGMGTGRAGQDRARSLIRRARKAGYLPPATSTRS